LRSTASTTEKTAVFPLIPTAMTRNAIDVNPGVRAREHTAKAGLAIPRRARGKTDSVTRALASRQDFQNADDLAARFLRR
jgi:hypothetical protein